LTVAILSTYSLGAMQLRVDGVMRSFDADRNMVDAIGLSARQVELWFEGLPTAPRIRFRQEGYDGVNRTKVPSENSCPI
jgi:hypothetical protein